MQGKTYLCLDSLAIEIAYNHQGIKDLLDYLLLDLKHYQPEADKIIEYARIEKTKDAWKLNIDTCKSNQTSDQLESLALPFLNASLRILAKQNQRCISLHAGLVSDATGSILLPGIAASGKTNVCFWLTHLGLNYHTDEFVLINNEDTQIKALTRPFTLRLEAFERLRGLDIPLTKRENFERELIKSRNNIWLAHRSVNPNYQIDIPPIKAIIFPQHTSEDSCQLTQVSRAHAAMELMRCHYQSQGFDDHGVTQISALVRSAPVYVLVYNRFDQLADSLDELIKLPRMA